MFCVSVWQAEWFSAHGRVKRKAPQTRRRVARAKPVTRAAGMRALVMGESVVHGALKCKRGGKVYIYEAQPSYVQAFGGEVAAAADKNAPCQRRHVGRDHTARALLMKPMPYTGFIWPRTRGRFPSGA